MDIRELLDATRGGRSFEELAAAHPNSPSRQFWHQLATKPQRAFPKPETIRGIAATLRVTQATVVLAWAQSLGIPMVHEARLAQLLPPGSEQLSDSAIATVLSMVNELIPEAPAGKVLPMSAPTSRQARTRTPTGEQKVARGQKQEHQVPQDD